MFKSEEESYDALAEFWLSAPADKHVEAWEWACQDFSGDVDEADKGAIPTRALRATVSQVLELTPYITGKDWSDGLQDLFESIEWTPTCWRVRNEQYMAERMADEFKD